MPVSSNNKGKLQQDLLLKGRTGKTSRMAKQLDYHTIHEIFTRFQASDPEPKGELDHVNAYTLVVAVALSAQATDKGVNKATAELFKIADTPAKMLAWAKRV